MENVNDDLRKSAKEGHAERVSALLLHAKCDPMSQNESGFTALMLAAGSGHTACLQLLLPVSNTKTTTKDEITALMWAAANGQATCLKLLLPFNDASSKDKRGMTALMWTAARGHINCVKLLLPFCDPTDQSNSGRAAISYARGYGHNEIAAFINAYIQAATEVAALKGATAPGKAGKSSSLRV